MSLITRSRGGWWHDYVCPSHGTELGQPVGGYHPCPYGCQLSEPRHEAAWTVLEHQAWAREARLLAHKFSKTGCADDRDRAITIVRDFAEYYAEVLDEGWSESSEAWMLRGKLFSQALTEAIWATQLADAVIEVAQTSVGRERLGEPVLALLKGLLETVVSARQVLVHDQGNPESNYTAWLDAAGGLLTRALSALGQPADVDQWVRNLGEHIRLAVTDDGWEWEGSTYYHLFVVRAYLLNLRDTDPHSLPHDVVARLASMIRTLAQIAAPDGSLPQLHDGPYDRRGVHQEVLEICVLAKQMWTETGLGNVETWVRTRLGADHDGLEDQLQGWFGGQELAGIEVNRASVLFPLTGYAVLRDAADTWQAIIDAGPHGGAHGHLDKLGLYLYGDGVAWQPAPGVPPYGSELRRGYYARTAAHPTVRIDDLDQAECTGTISHWTHNETVTRVVAHADQAYPGVWLTRELVMTGKVLIDVVTMRSDSERDLAVALRPGVGLEIRAKGEDWISTFTGSDGATLHGLHRGTVPGRLEAKPGRGPSDDPARQFTTADWLARGTSAGLVSVYQPGPEPLIQRVEFQTHEGSNRLGSVRVHFVDGTSEDTEVDH